MSMCAQRSAHSSTRKKQYRYTTKLCGDFYLAHGGVSVQDCVQPIPAIMSVSSGMPTDLPCSD